MMETTQNRFRRDAMSAETRGFADVEREEAYTRQNRAVTRTCSRSPRCQETSARRSSLPFPAWYVARLERFFVALRMS
jgi:hypothetical protein